MPMVTLRTGSFPHQMYVAQCDCINGRESKTTNYTGQVIAPPTCSSCKRPYQLDERLANQPFSR